MRRWSPWSGVMSEVDRKLCQSGGSTSRQGTVAVGTYHLGVSVRHRFSRVLYQTVCCGRRKLRCHLIEQVGHFVGRALRGEGWYQSDADSELLVLGVLCLHSYSLHPAPQILREVKETALHHSARLVCSKLLITANSKSISISAGSACGQSSWTCSHIRVYVASVLLGRSTNRLGNK